MKFHSVCLVLKVFFVWIYSNVDPSLLGKLNLFKIGYPFCNLNVYILNCSPQPFLVAFYILKDLFIELSMSSVKLLPQSR